MTWFKVDDNSAFHQKVLDAGNEAWGAYCRVGAWCSAQLSDGRFSRAIAVTIAPMRVWTRLIQVKLVDPLERGEMQMHDYLDRNPSKAQVLADRERTKRRVNGFRNAVTTPAVTPAVAAVPSRPVPSQPEADAAAREVREEPRSETRLKSVPPPPPDEDPLRSPEHVAIALQIRSHHCFRGVDAHHVADHHVGRMQGTGQKLEWAITAINECAEKKGGLGLTAEAMQGALVGFLKAGRGERREQPVQGEAKGSAAYREDDDAETIARLRRMPKRRTAQDMAGDAAKLDSEQKAGTGTGTGT